MNRFEKLRRSAILVRRFMERFVSLLHIYWDHESGRDDFHVVPNFGFEKWDDVEVVPTRFMKNRAVISPITNH
jgi:hypothetical protein